MKLLVIDGNSIVNRAFYGIRLLTTSDGQFTNGIYGFLTILLKLKQETGCDAVAAAFDRKEPTFRHRMYDGYKAGRHAMPDELASQLPVLKELLGYLGVTTIEKPGFEADDILGTLAAAAGEDDMCYIATGDRDSLQLIGDRSVVLLAATKGGKPVTTLYDKETLFEEYGVSPEGMLEIKALMGDSSDNIPGVSGIGKKTAGDLIIKYGTIDNIYDNIDTLDLKPSVRQKLLQDRDNAFLSRTLGKISRDVDIDTDYSHYADAPADPAAAIRLLSRLEMFGMIERLGLTADGAVPVAEEPEVKDKKTLVCREDRDLTGLLGEIKKAGRAYYTVVYRDETPADVWLLAGDEIRYVSDTCLDFDYFFESLLTGEWEKYTSDVKKQYKYADRHSLEIRNVVCDTDLAGYISNPSLPSYDPLKMCASMGLTVPDVECDEVQKENCLRTAALPALCERLLTDIKDNGQEFLLTGIELPLAAVLARMENIGFAVDRDAIAEYGEKLGEEIEKIKKEIFDEAGFEFNLNSPKQLGTALFDNLKLPAGKKTKSGYSTSAEVLEKLAEDYPVVAKILRYRTLTKLKSTYCDGLLKAIDIDGRVRSTFDQTETRTGRISSQEPNLQNIPVRYEEGKQIRKFFGCREGSILIDADYSQIELRVLAHISGDEAMIGAFRSGLDIHRATASQVFGMPEEYVTPLMRSRAKAVNFGIVYGIGAFSLAKDIGVSIREADDYIKGYLRHYSGIDRYMQKCVQTAKDCGYAETIFHRRRYLPELSASNRVTKAFGERVARNMPIQGTAADIIKIAMVNTDRRLREECPEARLIMQVHDELIVECPEEKSDRASAILKQEMEHACRLDVDLVVDIEKGTTWFEAKS